MSKIALTPNSSGTGTFTLAAPNSNTSRTLTLPDSAGELLVNGTTSNVGIGATTADSQLHIEKSDVTAYNGSATDGQLSAGATAFVQQTGGSNNAISQIVFQPRSGYGYNRIVNSGGSAPYMALTTNNAERMRIDASGNVGIGTNSPSNTLSLEGSGTGLNINSTNDEVKKIAFENSGVVTGYIGSSTSSPLRFLDGSAAERMRIAASGHLLFAKTSTSSGVGGIRFAGDAPGYAEYTRAGGSIFYLNRLTDTGTIITFAQANTSVGTISVTGSATAYNTSSDYRLKTDAQPMTGASARVQALNPVNFEWIASGDRVDGFLAHEAATVVPESVTGTKDAMQDEEYEVTPAVLDDDGNETTAAVMGTRSVPDYQGIDQSKLVPLLTAALQEALTKIEAMEARLTALESV